MSKEVNTLLMKHMSKTRDNHQCQPN